MKYMYALLFVLAGSPALASVYATAAAAEEASRRGASEAFTRGVGSLDIEMSGRSKGKWARGNCALIASNKVITGRHVLPEDVTSVKATFYPDIVEFNEHFRLAVAENREGRPIPPFHGQDIRGMESLLDLESIVRHPTLDLAIATLRRPLCRVPILPILLDRPAALANGYMVSYGDVEVLGHERPVAEGKRHISVLDIEERRLLSVIPGGDDGIWWTQDWGDFAPVAGVSPLALMETFVPHIAGHRLRAYSKQMDSGAPIIVKMGPASYKLAGLHVGKQVLQHKDTGMYTVLGTELPLYTAADWIRENM